MEHLFTFLADDEAELRLLAELLAVKCRAGDVIALWGDLGAGKTTFARAFIRAALADRGAEVPSPTFAILQTYDSPRFPIRHYDLYRLSEPDELYEVGLPEDGADGVSLIEWPDRAGVLLPDDRIDIRLTEAGSAPDSRQVQVAAAGSAAGRIARVQPLVALIDETWPRAGADDFTIDYLQGDASTRAYARLTGPFGTRILMDSPRQPDGPPIRDGLPYSRIAHLAESIEPFLAIGDTLRRAGYSAPCCDGFDADAGVAIFEDLGPCVFGSAAAGGGVSEAHWQAATELLCDLHNSALPARAVSDSGLAHELPRYDAAAMSIEIELLTDWYLPHVTGAATPASMRVSFLEAWAPHLDALAAERRVWMLRDYHSPNLVWLPERAGVQRVGLLDFQDAQLGPAAYDLVSLLQDARIDIDAEIEQRLFEHYVTLATHAAPDFDRARFARTYAIAGAQRNTKILGIFARLANRDGKRGYLAHIPRIRKYLARNLADPSLSALKHWYDTHMP